MILDFTGDSESLSTPFEAWCAAAGIHPDAFDAWALYESSTATAAAS